MKILIAAASKHGSTREIADTIAAELRTVGHEAAVYDADNAPAPDGFDAALIGSAIYMGSWMSEAREYVDKNEDTLRRMPVWLFSSGPLGEENPQPEGDPEIIGELIRRLNARGHENFVGALDKNKLGLGEKLIVRGVKAPYGDFRQWDVVRRWARQVAADLDPAGA